MPRFRRPSLFAIGRAAVFLLAPIPLLRWWYYDGYRPVLRWYFYHAYEPAIALAMPLRNPRHHVGGNFWAEALVVGRDVDLYNVGLWYRQNRPWPPTKYYMIAQALGVAGAGGALLQPPRRRRGHCPACGYNMQGLTPSPHGGNKCPECGTESIEVRAAGIVAASTSPHPYSRPESSTPSHPP